MGNLEDYNDLIETIKAIPEKEIRRTLSIPVKYFTQEAENLCKTCEPDKDILVAAGLSWETMTSLPARCGALRHAESNWVTQRYLKKVTGRLWNEKSKEGTELLQKLVHLFKYAYRNNVYILNRINAIVKSQSSVSVIQNLNDLAVLGKDNPEELQSISFDENLLVQATALSDELADILARATAEGDYSEAKKIRDQAFTYAKNAFDEVCACGRFVFWKDPDKKKKYACTYIRRTRKKTEDSENTQNEPAADTPQAAA